MKILRKIIGSIIATLGTLAVLLGVYQLVITANLQWLVLILPSLGVIIAGFILIVGSIKDFIEALLSVFQMIP